MLWDPIHGSLCMLRSLDQDEVAVMTRDADGVFARTNITRSPSHMRALSTWARNVVGFEGFVVMRWLQAAVAACQMAKDRKRKSR